MSQTTDAKQQVKEHRRANLRMIIAHFGGPAPLARRLGYRNSSYVVQMGGPTPARDVSAKTARMIEAELQLPVGWMDCAQTALPLLSHAPTQDNSVEKPSNNVEEAGTPAKTSTKIAATETSASSPRATPAKVSFVVDVIHQVGKAVEDSGVQIPPAKMADVIAMAYEDAQEHGSLRISFVQQIMRLLK